MVRLTYYIFAVLLITSLVWFGTPQSVVLGSDSGALFAGSGTSDGGAGQAWTSPENVTADDGSYATNSPSAVTGVENLQATDFGFEIPAGATIDGIELATEMKDSANGNFNVARLVKDGATPVGDDKAPDVEVPATDTVYTLGDASDLWAESWTADEINASTFGSTFDFTAGSFFGLSVDYVTITVYYTEAPPEDPDVAGAGAIRTGGVQVRTGHLQVR